MAELKYPYSDEVIKKNWMKYPLYDKDHTAIVWDLYDAHETIFGSDGRLNKEFEDIQYTGEGRAIEKAIYVPFNSTNKKEGDFKSSSTDGIRAGFYWLDDCSRSKWCVKLDHDNNKRAYRIAGNGVIKYGDETRWASRLGNDSGDLGCFNNSSKFIIGNVPRLRSESYLIKNVSFADEKDKYDISKYKSVSFNGVQIDCSFTHNPATSETDRYNIIAVPSDTRGFNESDSNIEIDNWLKTEFRTETEIMSEVELVSKDKESSIQGINSILANEEHLKLLKQAITTTGSRDAEDMVLMTVYHSQDEAFKIDKFKGTVKSSLPDKPTAFDYSSFDISNMTIYKNQAPNYYESILNSSSNEPIINFLYKFLNSETYLDLDKYYNSSSTNSNAYLSPGWQRIIQNSEFMNTYHPAKDKHVLVNFPSISKESLSNFKLFIIYQFNKICQLILTKQFADARNAVIALFSSKSALYSEGVATLFTPAFIDVVLDGLYHRESFLAPIFERRERYSNSVKSFLKTYSSHQTCKYLQQDYIFTWDAELDSYSKGIEITSTPNTKEIRVLDSYWRQVSDSLESNNYKKDMKADGFSFDTWKESDFESKLSKITNKNQFMANQLLWSMLYQFTYRCKYIAYLGKNAEIKTNYERATAIVNYIENKANLITVTTNEDGSSEITENKTEIETPSKQFKSVNAEMKPSAFDNVYTSDMIGCIKHYESEGVETAFWPYQTTAKGARITTELLEQASSVQYINELTITSNTTITDKNNETTSSNESSYLTGASSFGFNLIKSNAPQTQFTAFGIPAYDRPSNFYSKTLDESSVGLAVNADSILNLKAYIKDSEIIDFDRASVFAAGGYCPGVRTEVDYPFSIPFTFELHLNSKNDMVHMYKSYYSNGIKRNITGVPICACRDDDDTKRLGDSECDWPKRDLTHSAFIKCEYLWKEIDWNYLRWRLDDVSCALGNDLGTIAIKNNGWKLNTIMSGEKDSMLLNDILNDDCPISKFITKAEPFCNPNIHLQIPMQQNVESGRAYSQNPYCWCPFWATRDGFHSVPLYLPQDRLNDTGISIVTLMTSTDLGAITNSEKANGRFGYLRMLDELDDYDDSKHILKLKGEFDCKLHISGFSDMTGRDSSGLCPYRMKADTYFFSDSLYRVWDSMIRSSTFIDYVISVIASMLEPRDYALANLQQQFSAFAEYCCLSDKTTLFNIPIGPVAMQNEQSSVLGYNYFLSDYNVQYKDSKSKDRKQIINTTKTFNITVEDSNVPNVINPNNYLDMLTKGLSSQYGVKLEDDDENAAIVVRIPEDSRTMLSIPRVEYFTDTTISFVFATYINKDYKGMKAASSYLAEEPAIVFCAKAIGTNEASQTSDFAYIGQVQVPRLSIIRNNEKNGWSFNLTSNTMNVYYNSKKTNADIRLLDDRLEINYNGRFPSNQAFIKAKTEKKSLYPSESERSKCDAIIKGN